MSYIIRTSAHTVSLSKTRPYIVIAISTNGTPKLAHLIVLAESKEQAESTFLENIGLEDIFSIQFCSPILLDDIRVIADWYRFQMSRT